MLNFYTGLPMVLIYSIASSSIYTFYPSAISCKGHIFMFYVFLSEKMSSVNTVLLCFPAVTVTGPEHGGVPLEARADGSSDALGSWQLLQTQGFSRRVSNIFHSSC